MCGEGEQDSLTRRGCRQTMYKARSLNLQSTKCREMRNYPGTPPEKAASGVEGDSVPPVPARGKLTSGLEFPATA